MSIARKFIEEVKVREREAGLNAYAIEADDFDEAICAAHGKALMRDLGLWPFDPANPKPKICAYQRCLADRGNDKLPAGLIDSDYERGLVAAVVARQVRRAA